MQRRTRLLGLLAAAAGMLLAVPTSAPAGVSVGQSGWAWGSPLPQGNTIRALELAGDRGYAAGDFGTLLRTDDAGATWSGLSTGITSDLQRVRLLGTDSIVIGGGCSMRRSDDGGRTFTRLPFSSSDVSCPAQVASFAFPSARMGYIALSDGTVLRTDDGGQSFSRRTAVPGTAATGGAVGRPTDVWFTADGTGVAATSTDPSQGRIYRTTDGGGSWTLVASVDSGVRAFTFVSATDGFAVGDAGRLLVTHDGGEKWTASTLTVGGQSPNLTTIHCANAQVCLITTERGDQLLRTTDGGQTVRAVSASTDAIHAAAFASPSRAVAAGDYGATVVSADGGVTYSPVGGRLADAYTGLRAVSATVAYAFGLRGALAKTTDGGQTWTAGSVSTSNDVIDVAFPNAQTGFALDAGGGLLRSDNGGSSWKILNTGTSSRPRAVLAPSANRVLLVGPNGLRRSTNGGGEFSPVRSKVVKSAALWGVDPAGTAVFVYGPSTLAVSFDGGASFRKVPRPSRVPLQRIDFVSSRAGFGLDTTGRVWSTANRGRRWTELPGVGAVDPTWLAFTSTRSGFAALPRFAGQSAGFVLRTTDGGRSWRPQLVSRDRLTEVAAAGGTGLALRLGRVFAGPPGAAGPSSDLFATSTGGDAGRRSRLTLTPSRSRLGRAGVVKIAGRLSPAEGGEQVQVSFRPAGGRWRSIVATAASNGTFTVTRRIEKSTVFVAQWRGDDERAGAGTAAVEVRVGRR